SNKPYLALWTYKVFKSERFDLLGNSLAILSGIVSSESAILIIDWVESECIKMKACGELNVDLPPNFFPFIHPEDTDWHTRYAKFNLPGNYHNGGIWPFICGLYIAAIVATENKKLAEIKLIQLTELIQGAGNGDLEFGFNEWYKAQNGKAMGQDWQTWSAALYLYAVKCVESNNTPFFDIIRKNSFEDII
ncbi:MAG TPA: glycoside hydrolase 100 family protein, partial [Anditalea sp.]|nr:glycoside hydrolase 100 family protein [Anditalea sp.]